MFGPADSAVGRVTRTRAQGTGSADDVEREPILSSRHPHCCHGHARLSRERTKSAAESEGMLGEARADLAPLLLDHDRHGHHQSPPV
jgi:hypothetical protein